MSYDAQSSMACKQKIASYNAQRATPWGTPGTRNKITVDGHTLGSLSLSLSPSLSLSLSLSIALLHAACAQHWVSFSSFASGLGCSPKNSLIFLYVVRWSLRIFCTSFPHYAWGHAGGDIWGRSHPMQTCHWHCLFWTSECTQSSAECEQTSFETLLLCFCLQKFWTALQILCSDSACCATEKTVFDQEHQVPRRIRDVLFCDETQRTA